MKKLFVLLLLIGAGYFGYEQYKSNRSNVLEPIYEFPYVVVYGKTDSKPTMKSLGELTAEGLDPIFENMDEPDVKKEIFERIEEAGYSRNQIVLPIIDVNGNILIGYQPDRISVLYNAQEK